MLLPFQMLPSVQRRQEDTNKLIKVPIAQETVNKNARIHKALM
jgi:hypothetical protein